MKLFCILLTKNDSAILRAWLSEHSGYFDFISVVDGSNDNSSEKICQGWSNVIYNKDPEGLITDQTLRHHGFEALRPFIKLGDWVFLGHPDEFLIHDPNRFVSDKNERYMWMPLLALPHPSEKEALYALPNEYNPKNVMKHYWYRTGQLPHCENRMFRFVEEPVWDLASARKSSSTIPVNVHGLPLSPLLPIYIHFKVTNFDVNRLDSNGKFLDSGLDTGIDRPFESINDLFFSSEKPWGEGYEKFVCSSEFLLEIFGDPPRILSSPEGSLVVVNREGRTIHH